MIAATSECVNHRVIGCQRSSLRFRAVAFLRAVTIRSILDGGSFQCAPSLVNRPTAYDTPSAASATSLSRFFAGFFNDPRRRLSAFDRSGLFMMFHNRRVVALVLGIIAAFAVWVSARSVDSWRLRSSVKAAKAAIAARSTRKAHRLLSEISAKWPGVDEVDFLLGACEQSLGQPAAAEKAWARVPASSPFGPSAAMYRARLVLEHDRFADAEGLLLIALRGTGPHATEARETLVNLYKLQGRFDEARILVSEATRSYPDTAGVLREMERLGSNNPMGLEFDPLHPGKSVAQCPGRRPNLAGMG